MVARTLVRVRGDLPGLGHSGINNVNQLVCQGERKLESWVLVKHEDVRDFDNPGLLREVLTGDKDSLAKDAGDYGLALFNVWVNLARIELNKQCEVFWVHLSVDPLQSYRRGRQLALVKRTEVK